MPTSPFDALIDDLMAVQATRTTQPPQRDTVSRSARHAAEAQRNRRMAQQPRRLAKAAPVDQPAPNFAAIASRQERIAQDLEQSRIQAQQDAIRSHLATLRQAAKAGRLSAHDAALLDVYAGQAAAMGLQP